MNTQHAGVWLRKATPEQIVTEIDTRAQGSSSEPEVSIEVLTSTKSLNILSVYSFNGRLIIDVEN